MDSRELMQHVRVKDSQSFAYRHYMAPFKPNIEL